jgi:hypothetical protein
LDERSAFLEDFSVPAPFVGDLYELTSETRASFPSFRYMVIGGARTGSNMHVDPDHTSAWNALLSGVKRWTLFPPEADAATIRVPAKGTPPLYWWSDAYPQLAEAEGSSGMIETIQYPGDVIYVPAGWWHNVLNSDQSGLTIAVTQNLISPESLPGLWPTIARCNPGLARAFARLLTPAVAPAPRSACFDAVKARVPAGCLEVMARWLERYEEETQGSKVLAHLPPGCLFFNVEGVLSVQRPDGGHAFSDDCLAQLRRVVRDAGVELVLTAPYRASEDAKAQLAPLLHPCVFRRSVTTAPMAGGLASQILHFTVQPTSAVNRWAVVDADDLFHGEPEDRLSMMQRVLFTRFVKVDPKVGLDKDAADRLIAILTEEDDD